MALKFIAPNEIGQAFSQTISGVLPQIVQGSIASSAAVVTTQMQGLAIYFTPQSSTRVKLFINGQVVPAATTVWALVPCYGTGTAPTNAAAAAGTAVVGYGATGIAPTGTAGVSFATTSIITGLTPGTTYWFDLKNTFTASTMGVVSKLTYFIEEV